MLAQEGPYTRSAEPSDLTGSRMPTPDQNKSPATHSRAWSLQMLSTAARTLDAGIIFMLGHLLFFARFPNGLSILPQYSVSILIATLLASNLLNRVGTYQLDSLSSFGGRAARVIGAWALTFSVLLTIAFALKISAFYSRIWAVSWFLAVPLALVLAQTLLIRWIAAESRKGRFAIRSVIVGNGLQTEALAKHLIARKTHTIDLVGIVPLGRTTPSQNIADLGLNVIANLDELVALIRKNEVHEVFIALPWAESDRIDTILRQLAQTPVAIRLAPDLIGYRFSDRSLSPVADLPMLSLFDRPISGWDQLSKAIEDKILAGLFVILLSPFFLIIAAAIKLDSPGPVFFKQRRFGYNNLLIEVWKFRSMFSEASDESGARQATKGDSRVTRVGAFLRRYSLDELPQLFNVLQGSMSMVGPRPHPIALKSGEHLFEDIVEGYAARHRVKPGITGWAQVNGWRGETDTHEKIERRVEHDLYYIDNWSIWFDLWILIRTLFVVLHDENAY